VNEDRYLAIQQEALSVLERTMSSAIRPETIGDITARVPAMVSLSFPEDQATVVAELVIAFVAPNSQYSEELTQAARQAARDAVEPATRTLIAGQTVVSQGEVLDTEDVEALQKLGLVQPQTNWQEIAAAAGITVLMAGLIVFYLRRKHSLAIHVRRVTTSTLLGLAFLLIARLMIPAHTVVPYAFPLPAYGLTVAALMGVEPGLVFALPLAILTAYSLPNSLELTIYYLVTSIFSILALGRARRLLSFALAGLTVGIAGSAVVLVYRLPSPNADLIGIATLTAAAFFNGLASASITILLHSALARFLGAITSLQLIDLTRPDHPLLRLLLREAPGTYQHSLQVANLAEQAAERIGADALLTRVGALYHDIGKTVNPIYFIENQPPGFVNPHEGLSPAESAAIIIQHVLDGLDLGRKNKLPQRLLDFIAEHHGTGLTRYQYYNAIQAASGDEGRVDQTKFRYPGPRPQSRETAILMLADGSEARVRAERPNDDQKLLGIIKSVISDRIASGELDDTRLTLADLKLIAESFAATLRGVYHPRLQYPRLQATSTADEITVPLPRRTEASVEERR
jgi:putative nucleotidyltransferase with HDIG domain